MPYDPLERLRHGNVEFLYYQTFRDEEILTEKIKSAPDRLDIINGFISVFEKGQFTRFVFGIIYDIPEYKDLVYEWVHNKETGELLLRFVTPERLSNMLYNSPVGKRILYENFEKFIYFLKDDEDRSDARTMEDGLNDLIYLKAIIEYAFGNDDKDLLHKLSRYEDMHIRFLFMKYLLENHPNKIDDIYDDITKYITSVTYEPLEQISFLEPTPMKQEYLSEIAVGLLTNNHEKEYEYLKGFIFREYEHNNLASELFTVPFMAVNGNPKIQTADINKYAIQEEEFNRDVNTLFETSANYRFHIFFNHSAKLREDLLTGFASKMRYYLENQRIDKYSVNQTKSELKNLDYYGLCPMLEEWTEKYMDLSQSKEYGYVGGGATCSCYRIGDYVIKLVRAKFSFEDVICPNLYLTAKNYEEIYVRGRTGRVLGGIEVQKYLTREARDVETKYFGYFRETLADLGYVITDALTYGVNGDNAMLLDSYRDADCSNPEKLPDWFKEYPIVLVDRDTIYPINGCPRKQLRCICSC